MKSEIGFVCIGQAGGNIGNLFDEIGFNVLYINTSKEDLDTLKNAKHVYHIPGGEGCYKNREEAKRVLAKEIDALIDKIKAQFAEQDFIGVIFGTGGGTGSGMSPYLIDILINDELFDEDDNPTHTIFTVPILPDLNEAPLARLNSYECFSELNNIANLGACYVIDNTKPDSLKMDYGKYKLSLNKKFVNYFTSFIEIPEKHKSEFGIIDKAEIKEMIRTPGMQIISVTPRKTSIAAIIEDLERSPLFAPIDSDVNKRKLKYVASSTIEPLDYDTIVQAFGHYIDEYHTYNQEKNIIVLAGLRMPFNTLKRIEDSVASIKDELIRSMQEDTDNPLSDTSMIKSFRPARTRKRVVETTKETDNDSGKNGTAKPKRSRRRNILDMYG